MPCKHAAMLYQQIERAQTDLRNHNKLDSPFARLAVGDKDAIRKKAKEELRSANGALKEDPSTATSATKTTNATVAVRFWISSCTSEFVDKQDAPETTQCEPVPTGITGAFRRLLQIYRSYRKTISSPSAQPNEQVPRVGVLSNDASPQ
jgi:hypothetical protein